MIPKKWTTETVLEAIADKTPVTAFGQVMAKGDLFAMRGVCAVYRRQTLDEQKAKVTKHTNKRGFSQAHAWKASDMARWMADDALDGIMRRPVGTGATQFGTWKTGIAKGRPRYWGCRELCRYFAEVYARQIADIANEAEAKKQADLELQDREADLKADVKREA